MSLYHMWKGTAVYVGTFKCCTSFLETYIVLVVLIEGCDVVNLAPSVYKSF